MCPLLEGRLSLHDFVCDRVLFSLNKEFFRYWENTSFWGKTPFFFFLNSHFLRIFWAGVVGAIDTFVAEHIMKTCLYSFDPLQPHFYIVKLGFTGVYIIFLISAQNIDCGYTLEPPQRGGSNEYPQSMFWAEIRKMSKFFLSQNL